MKMKNLGIKKKKFSDKLQESNLMLNHR